MNESVNHRDVCGAPLASPGSAILFFIFIYQCVANIILSLQLCIRIYVWPPNLMTIY